MDATKRDVNDLRKIAEQEAIEGLENYSKFCIIRPTGFGKTGMLTNILKRYDRVLYLYPTTVIKETVLDFYYGLDRTEEQNFIPHVDFLSYMGLVRMENEDFDKLPKYDLIIADETHRIGAPKSLIAMFKLLGVQPDAKLLGATATPERSDSVDEITIFFGGHISSEYTLHNAFQDKILQQPIYVYCSYGKSDIKETEKAAKLEIKKFKDPAEEKKAYDLLKARLIEIGNLQKMDRVIADTCKKHATRQDYLKFIVFFKGYDHIRIKEKEVQQWFADAYPDMTINTLKVTGETEETYTNAEKLGQYRYRPGVIDLIFTCDMLNMGYHINDLTGVIFYRGTTSNTVYIQQLGRVLSTGNNIPGIVFDIVDNLHRKALYVTYDRKDKTKKIDINGSIIDIITGNGAENNIGPEATDISEYMDNITFIDDDTDYYDDDTDTDVPCEDETDNTSDNNDKTLKTIRSTIRHFKRLASNPENTPEDKMLIQAALNGLSETEHALINTDKNKRRWTHQMNILFAEDLIVESHYSTYKELIAKTVAEQYVQRCKLAYALWVKHGGKPDPCTRLAWLAQQSPEGTPLELFTKLKQVKIDDVLDVMGVE